MNTDVALSIDENEYRRICWALLQCMDIEVAYSEDQLEMANSAICKIKTRIENALDLLERAHPDAFDRAKEEAGR